MLNPLLVLATFAFEEAAPSQVSQYVIWTLSCTVLVLAGTCWLALSKTAAKAALANAKLVPIQAALDKASGKVRAFLDSQGRFVGNLAQEIKAPLATVLIHADLLLANGQDPATVRRYSKSIAEDIRHLSDLVESFLRLARPYTDEDTTSHVPVHFHDLVLEAVRRCQSLAGTRGVNIVPMLVESNTDSSVEVLGDAVLLESMIENLLRNALVSAPRGTRVDLHVKVQGEELTLSVRDHGKKMDEDLLDSVMDGFFQVPTPPRATVGTGLSLAIAKRVAEHHRGTISLRNCSEGGCEFEVQLPLWKAVATTSLPETQTAVA